MMPTGSTDNALRFQADKHYKHYLCDMSKNSPIRVKSISEYHRLKELPPPKHPLISVVDYAQTKLPEPDSPGLIVDYYSIAIKRGVGKMFYGQQEYDFDEGVMFFLAP